MILALDYGSLIWLNNEKQKYEIYSNKFYHSVNDHESVSIAFYVDTNLTVIDAMQKWIKKIYKNLLKK